MTNRKTPMNESLSAAYDNELNAREAKNWLASLGSASEAEYQQLLQAWRSYHQLSARFRSHSAQSFDADVAVLNKVRAHIKRRGSKSWLSSYTQFMRQAAVAASVALVAFLALQQWPGYYNNGLQTVEKEQHYMPEQFPDYFPTPRIPTHSVSGSKVTTVNIDINEIASEVQSSSASKTVPSTK